MAMDGDLVFPHSDPLMLPDFSQNHFEDFGKSFFSDSTLDTINGANLIETTEFGYFKPLTYSESNPESSFGRVDAGRTLELATTLPNAAAAESSAFSDAFFDAGRTLELATTLPNAAAEESSAFSDAFFDVVNYQKQDIDLKQISMDPYTMTDNFSSLISLVKTNSTERSIEMPEATVAADALNSLSLEQLRQQQYSHDFDVSSSHGIAEGKSGKPYTPLLSVSTQISENETVPSLPSSSSAFQAQMPHVSLSFIAEYPESLSNSSFASIEHASAPSAATSTASCILDEKGKIMIMNTSALKAEKQIVLPDKLVQPCFNLMSSREQGGSSDASGVHTFMSVADDSTGDCFRGVACQAPCSLPVRLMQRSFSSHSLGQLRTKDLSSQNERIAYNPTPVLDSKSLSVSLWEIDDKTLSPNIYSMRRVYSTGDIQNLDGKKSVPCGSTSPLYTDVKSKEAKVKIGCYTVEERKNRIHRYRQKRTERNFHKKIKYTCRKTLADSRPRVRGRFARNEDGTELQETNSNKNEDEEDEVDVTLEETSCAFNQNVYGVSRMPPVKIEHPRNGSFWNTSNARNLRGAH